MTLQQKINDDLKTALKAGKNFDVGVLRFLTSVIHNKEIEKYREKKTYELTDEEVLNVLLAEAKKRKEAILMFEKGGRQDLVDKEKSELLIIEKYLPKQLSKEEVEKKIDEIIVTLRQAQGDIVFNNVMKEAMKELKGKTDAALVSAIIKERLG